MVALRPEDDGRKAAETIRSKYGLGASPIGNIISLAELMDIDVILVNAGEEEHGFTARDQQTGVTVIVANPELPAVRFRSTVAHEIGHHIFSEDLTDSVLHPYTSQTESRAHSFARHLLMPIEAIDIFHNPKCNFTPEKLLNSFVRRFIVSPKIAAYQLKRARVIDDNTCNKLAEITTPALAERYGWTGQYDDWNAQLKRTCTPTILNERATDAYLQGKLPAIELARILDSPVATVIQTLGEPPTPKNEGVNADEYLPDDDISDLL